MSDSLADTFIPDVELARITGRSARSVRRWRQAGLLPRRRLGRVLGILESDLHCLLAMDHGRPPTVYPDHIDRGDRCMENQDDVIGS